MTKPPDHPGDPQASGDSPERLDEAVAYLLGEMTGERLAAFEARLSGDPGLADRVRFVREAAEYRRDERELGVSASAIAAAKRAFTTQRPSVLRSIGDGLTRVIAAFDFDTRHAPGALGVRGGGAAQLAFSAEQAEADFELTPSATPGEWTLRGQIDADTESAWAIEVHRGGERLREFATSAAGSFAVDLPAGSYTLLASHADVDAGVCVEFGPIQIP